jgi:hypothetical protein
MIFGPKQMKKLSFLEVVLGGLLVSVLTIGLEVRGIKPCRGRWIFKGDKNPQYTFHRRGTKAGGPMSLDFTEY